MCPKREGDVDDSQQLFSASAPPASLSLLGNFEVRRAALVAPSLMKRTCSQAVLIRFGNSNNKLLFMANEFFKKEILFWFVL